MSLFTGLPRPGGGITTTDELQVAHYELGENLHFFGDPFYLCYQRGLLRLAQTGVRCADRGGEPALSFYTPAAVGGCEAKTNRSLAGGWARRLSVAFASSAGFPFSVNSMP